MFCPSSGTSLIFSWSKPRTSVWEITSSRAHWSFLCWRVTSCLMPVRKPCALVKPVSQYDFMTCRPFSSHVYNICCRSKRPVNQPPRFGINHEISAPLASLVQLRGTRASKMEFTSSSKSVVMTTVPSMAAATFLRFNRTMAMMFCNRWSSWNKKMFRGAAKPLSVVFGGPFSFAICARKISSTKSGGILLSSSKAWSFTMSSMDFPPEPPLSLGCVSMMVAIISAASFKRYVKSAFGCKPKMSGESTGGIVSMASRYCWISMPSGIL
mmetsp:Transcript_1536/g.4234  ORF Transcript_1536/g.4234 Transcript_1536/m.4234 type:complete len:268 (-) Transcript_1536:321-1124(-)